MTVRFRPSRRRQRMAHLALLTAIVVSSLAFGATVASARWDNGSNGTEVPVLVVDAIVAGINVYEFAAHDGNAGTGMVGVGMGVVSMLVSRRDYATHEVALIWAGGASIVVGVATAVHHWRTTADREREARTVGVVPYVHPSTRRASAVGLELRVRF